MTDHHSGTSRHETSRRERVRRMTERSRWIAVCMAISAQLMSIGALAEESADAELAQELTNPLADLITLPIQVNYDQNIGPDDDGTRVTTNVQPVIPIELNADWNLITRTIVPLVWQEDVFPGSGSQSGLGDVNLTMFLSPVKPTSGGLMWGAGPVLRLRTATSDKIGAEKWGAGPSLVVLTMRGDWTFGMLTNHVWSFAGNDDRRDISSTFLQPFITYTWPSAWTVSLQSESTYDWKTEDWSVPVNLALSKLVRLGRLPVNFQGGIGYWAESPEAGPDGVRFRLQANVVLPKSLFR